MAPSAHPAATAWHGVAGAAHTGCPWLTTHELPSAVMGHVLMGVGVSVCVVGISVVAMTWILWRKVRRHNEVCAARPNRPPLRWLASPETCARLHRRLRNAVLGLRRAVPARRRWSRREWTPIEVLASEVVEQAVSIDHRLVLARNRRAGGAEERAQAARRVEEIERAAHRLAAASLRSAGHGPESTEAALRRISDELDARESAWNELTLLEHEAGLGQPA
jgi:hypothetical protein